MEPGSYCVYSIDGTRAECADAAGPTKPPSRRLPVHAHERVSLRFFHNRHINDRPESIEVALVRIRHHRFHYVGWTGEAHRVNGADRHWRFRLPGDLDRANFLDVFVDLRQGDISYGAGLRARG